MTTDTSERKFEELICTALAGHPCEHPTQPTVGKPGNGYGGAGWSAGNPHDYDRDFCVDLVQLTAFLTTTQPESAQALALDEDGPVRRKFLARVEGDITKRVTIYSPRHWVKPVPQYLPPFH